jgi:hypothetical protein
MSEIRAGGHVIGDHGWEPADLLPSREEVPVLSMSNTKAELLEAAEAAGVEVAEDATKRQILEALDGAE